MVILQVNGGAYGLSGFKITHTCQPPGEIDVCDPNEHSIIINLGSTVNMSWKTDVSLTATPCKTHRIAVIRPANSKVTVTCRDPFEYLCVSISRPRTEQVLECTDPPFGLSMNIDDGVLTKLLLQLHEAVKDSGMSQQLFVESLCISLLMHLNTRYPATKAPPHIKGKLTPSQLVMVSEYIHSRLGQNISLKELCSLVSLSRYHFTRLFKGTLGVTPHRYILQSKIEYAKTLMTKRKGAILDAAYQLNFSDHAHFTKTFRKITGVTPSQMLNR